MSSIPDTSGIAKECSKGAVDTTAPFPLGLALKSGDASAPIPLHGAHGSA